MGKKFSVIGIIAIIAIALMLLADRITATTSTAYMGLLAVLMLAYCVGQYVYARMFRK